MIMKTRDFAAASLIALSLAGTNAIASPLQGPIAQHMVSIGAGQHSIYQLSRKRSSDTRCAAADHARAVLVSATNDWTFPRTEMYADGCWYISKSYHMVLHFTAIESGLTFTRYYPLSEFDQVEDFWSIISTTEQ